MFIAILSTLITVSANAADYKGSFLCIAKGDALRQSGTNLPANSRIHFSKYQDGENTLYKKMVGHVTAGYEEEPEYSYYGIFQYDQQVVNKEYRGRTYKNHDQLKDFDATATSDNDGGGMWGYLVINKDTSAKTFDAHYVFQAGDHMGGTIDYVCQKD